MSLIHGKLEAYFGVRVAADIFHDVFTCRPHHVSNMSSQKVQACGIHQGQWGKPGSVICWNYFHDGKAKVAKQVIGEIDNVNLSTTFKMIEGDLMTEYKNFKLVLKATPQQKTDQGEDWCLVHWILDYEKLNEDIPEPFSLLEFMVHLSKDIDDHHTKKT
ncbi:MLP-like protein 43 [Linum grandiflorum]